MEQRIVAAWTPIFAKMGSIDGGRALHSVLMAYQLDPRCSASDILSAMWQQGRLSSTVRDVLTATFEAFSLGGPALKAAYPYGNALYEVVLASGFPEADAWMNTLAFCRPHQLPPPTSRYTAVQWAWKPYFGYLSDQAKHTLRMHYAPRTEAFDVRNILAGVGVDGDQLAAIKQRYDLVGVDMPEPDELVKILRAEGLQAETALRRVAEYCAVQVPPMPYPSGVTHAMLDNWLLLVVAAEPEPAPVFQSAVRVAPPPPSPAGRPPKLRWRPQQAAARVANVVWASTMYKLDARNVHSRILISHGLDPRGSVIDLLSAIRDTTQTPDEFVGALYDAFQMGNALEIFPQSDALVTLVQRSCPESDTADAKRFVVAFCREKGLTLPTV